MPGPTGTIAVALDFDGSLVDHMTFPIQWRPRAKDFIVSAAAAGIKLYLHSCRCAPSAVLEAELPWEVENFWRNGLVPEQVRESWRLFEEMRAFLEMEGVWHLVEPWTRPGKPIADLYPDDLGERPDWAVLAGELGVTLTHVVETDGRRYQGAGPGPAPKVGGPAAAPGPSSGTAGPAPGPTPAP
jgi:hypothetical protein